MSKPENVKCPECGGPMVSRVNRQNQQRFWGCATYPECRGTRDTDGMSKQERREDMGIDTLEPEDDFHPGHPRFYGSN